MSMVLLWTNPNPSSDFVEQTINVDMSTGELFLIKARTHKGNNSYITVIFTKEGKYELMKATPAVDGYKYDIAYRGMTIGSNSIAFANAKHSNASDYEDPANGWMVPEQIFKIK